MMHSSVTVQITPESRPAMPSWMGEVAAFAQILTHEGILKAIQEQVRFARARFGQYDVFDFVAVLIGYALAGEPTLLARKPFPSPGGLFDRTGEQWIVVDVDGTRQAARQRALPQTELLPAPHRRFDQVCAPGYQGRKRGEVVRTRTVLLQTHTHQFLGTFGGPGTGTLNERAAHSGRTEPT
jgi:hypothetical protein